MTVGPNPATEASMAKVGWTVQGAFFGRNSHSIRESGPTPCREAAQSNVSLHWTGSSRFSLFQWGRRWRLLPASELCVRPHYAP